MNYGFESFGSVSQAWNIFFFLMPLNNFKLIENPTIEWMVLCYVKRKKNLNGTEQTDTFVIDTIAPYGFWMFNYSSKLFVAIGNLIQYCA